MVTKVKERGRYVDGLFGLLLTSDRGTGENSREGAKEKRGENEKAETGAEPWRSHGLLPKPRAGLAIPWLTRSNPRPRPWAIQLPTTAIEHRS